MGENPPTFEEAMDELIKIVGQLEAGNLALHDSIELFERSQALVTQCTQLLDQAELRLEELRPAGGSYETVPFEPGGE